MPILARALIGIVALTTGAGAAIEAQVSDGGSYRVDMEFVQDGERVTMRRYVDGPRSRLETVLDGETFITIEVGDAAGTTYVLMPEERRAMKMTAAAARVPAAPSPAAASPSADRTSGDLPMELVGTETIDGKAARKYRVQTSEGDGFVWLDVEQELPLRMESGGHTIEMKNYDFAPVPADLFQVPKGYDVMDVDQMMRAGVGSMMLRGAVGAAGVQAGGAAGGGLGATAGATIGGAVGGPIGAMIGGFLGQSLGKKAGQKAGAAAAGAVIP